MSSLPDVPSTNAIITFPDATLALSIVNVIALINTSDAERAPVLEA